MSKPSAIDHASYADNQRWISIPYDRWDCQAFVEEMLRGVGAYQNWRGSNDMWRNAVTNRAPIELSHPPLIGAWVFTVVHDGGEKERGYDDDMGNAKHVGIYLGNNRVIHSSTGGVQWGKLSDSRWTHSGECIKLSFVSEQTAKPGTDWDAIAAKIHLMADEFIEYLKGD